MTTLDLAVVGNSNVAALIDRSGRIVWTSWPRIDGDPVFCALIDGEEPESGFFSIDFDEETKATEQSYDRNTAIARTVCWSASGASFVMTDFAPRFRQFGRMYRPPMLIRRWTGWRGCAGFARACARAWTMGGLRHHRSRAATTSATSRKQARSA